MIELSTKTQLGLSLTVMGLGLIFLGIILLFDKGLLVIGNFLFLAGICFLIGFRKTFFFFFQRQKAKGTLAFFAGLIILFRGHPIIGIMIELVGFYFLFRSFIPTAFQYLTSYLPFFGTVTNRSIV